MFMRNIDELSALDLIKLICIKQEKINNLSPWRWIKRAIFNADINHVLTEFFKNRTIFEQANALAGILINFHQSAPAIISRRIYNFIDITNSTVIFNFIPGYNEVKRYGRVIYSHPKNEFCIDINAIPNGLDGYAFIYNENMPLASKFKRLWDQDIINPLESMLMDTLISVVHIINSDDYNFQQEEYVND